MLVSGFFVDLDSVMLDLGVVNDVVSVLIFNFDFMDMIQYGSFFSVNMLIQDGYVFGYMVGLLVGSDGVIQGNYSNGQICNLVQVVLVNFINLNGLMVIGNNVWIEMVVFGQFKVGLLDIGMFGVL